MAYCYTLVSCDSLSYPDIDNLCWDSTHPYEGLVVYISEVFRGQAVDSQKTYTLTLNGIDTCECEDWLPALRTTTLQSCSPSYGVFRIRNCETGAEEVVGFPTADPTNNVVREDGTCECFEVLFEDEPATRLFGTYVEYDNCTDCIEARQDELCSFGERSLSYAVRVGLPKEAPPDRGFNQCCYTHKVLASSSDTDSYKNDETGVYFKRPTPNSSVVFKLVDSLATEYLLNDATYGEFLDFGGNEQPDLSYYIVDWRKVLLALGEDSYQIKQEITIAGITTDIFSNTFTLCEFSIDTADNTVRIDTVENGLLVRENVNFKGTNFRTSIRVRGYFGNPDYAYEQDNLFKRDYNTQQVSMDLNKTYKFQGLQLPDCIIDELMEFVLLGNELYISDYNKNNPSYNYERFAVVLENVDSVEYNSLNRTPNVNLTFTDRIKNIRKLNC